MSKRNIQFAAPEEPAFLKKLKAKIGFKQNYDNIETKAQKLKKEDVVYDKEEEEPVYVYDERSSISESELNTFKTKLKNERDAEQQDVQDAKEASKQKRIIFQKPIKKKDDGEGMQTVQGTSMKKSDKNDNLKNNRKYVKSVKNSNLLSFGDDDEEDEEDED